MYIYASYPNFSGFVYMSERVNFKDFPRTFKAMYQQIQKLNTEEKALEISKM